MATEWRLNEMLERAGMTPLDLAAALGVTHPSIYRLAAQRKITRITTKHLEAICRAVGCTTGEILVLVPAPPKPRAKRKARSRD